MWLLLAQWFAAPTGLPAQTRAGAAVPRRPAAAIVLQMAVNEQSLEELKNSDKQLDDAAGKFTDPTPQAPPPPATSPTPPPRTDGRGSLLGVEAQAGPGARTGSQATSDAGPISAWQQAIEEYNRKMGYTTKQGEKK